VAADGQPGEVERRAARGPGAAVEAALKGRVGSPAKAKPEVPGRTVPSGPATIVGAAGRPVSTTHWWTVAGDQLPAPSP